MKPKRSEEEKKDYSLLLGGSCRCVASKRCQRDDSFRSELLFAIESWTDLIEERERSTQKYPFKYNERYGTYRFLLTDQ